MVIEFNVLLGDIKCLHFGIPILQVDNIVVLTGGDLAQANQKILSNFLKKYRQIVNPNLLYVNISFAGKGCG